MNQNQDDLKIIVEACKQAGEIIMSYFGSELDVEKKAEAGNSPVTVADKEADAYLQKTLLSARPEYGWLSEETEDDLSHLTAKRSFVVDPIDGTKPFIHNVPEFVVSIAVIERGMPIVGVIYNPAKGQLFTCIKGEGVALNGNFVEKESVETRTFLGSVGESRKGYLEPYKNIWDVQTVGSIAYKMALVSAGVGDVMATFLPKNEWDIAAGHLMCEEMGFNVAKFDGSTPRYDVRNAVDFVPNLLVASAHEFDETLETVLKYSVK